MDFSDQQIERYARHLVMPEIGEEGQAKLRTAKVLVIGAGGLGAPMLLYLAAAGVGRLGVVDDDAVDLSNLQRQVIHGTADIGSAKTDSAARRLADVNPEVEVVRHEMRLARDNVMELIAGYDLIADGSDNFATRYLLNDACFFAGKTLVSAAIMRFDGQLSTFKPHAGAEHPCYRCLFPEQPEDPKQSCADVGVLASLPGVMGSLQATEVIKELTGIGESLSGRLLLYEGLAAQFRTIRARRDPACPLCSDAATIKRLEDAHPEGGASICAA